MDHKTLIEGFSQKSKILEDELTEVLNTLAEGKAPSEEDSMALSASMSQLREVYSEILAEAQSIDANIADAQSVFVCKRLFDEYDASKLEAQIDSLTTTLKRFTNVVSDSDEYGAALLPYQEEATDILNLISSTDVPLEAKLELSCSKQEAFLEAISMKNDILLSDAGESLLDSLDNYYSRKVVRGIVRGQYRETLEGGRASNSMQAGKPTPSGNDDPVPFEANHENESTIQVEQEAAQSPRAEQITKQPATKINQDGIAPDSTNTHDSNESVAERSKTKTLKSLNNVKKTGNISATSFKKELASMPRVVRDILPHISKFGAMNEDQLVLVISMFYEDWEEDRRHIVTQAIDALIRKGILSSFSTDEYGISYVLTSYGRSILEKESVKSFRLPKANSPYWHTPLCNHELKADKLIEENTLIETLAHADLLIQYLKAARASQNPESFINIYNKTACKNGRFTTQVRWGYETFECAIHDCASNARPSNNVLLVAKENERPEINDAAIKNVFLTDGTTLMKWEGSWSEDGPVSYNDPETKTETEPSENDHSRVKERANIEQPLAEDSSTTRKDVNQAPIEERTKNNSSPDAAAHPAKTDKDKPELSIRIRRLSEQDVVPSDEEFVGIAEELLSNATALIDTSDEYSNLAGAITLLLAASTIGGNKKSKLLLDQLSLATGLGISQIENTGRSIATSFPEYSCDNEALRFSAYCLALFTPQMAYDYDLGSAATMFLGNFDEFFPSLTAFKPLLNELNGISSISPEEGFSDNILDMLGNQAKRSDRLRKMRQRAKELRTPPNIKAKLHGIPQFIDACFGKDSELNLCMQIIEENKRADADIVRDVCSNYYVQKDKLKQIDESAIERKIDSEWHVAIAGKSTSRIRKLGSEPRKKAKDGFLIRLELMRKWLSYDDGKVNAGVLSKLKNKRASLIKIINELRLAGALPEVSHGSAVLDLLLQTLENKLDSIEDEPAVFKSLLKTGIISLNASKLPTFDEALNKVPYYEPWRNALRHLAAPIMPFENVRSCIFDDDSSDLFDNLNQLSLINELVPEGSNDYTISQSHLEQAEQAADAATDRFQDSLEIAYTYGQINEIQKEDLATSVSTFKEAFFARKDFGCWRQFLAALNHQIETMSAPQGEDLHARLNRHKSNLKRGTSSSLLNEAERLLLEERNYTVVEDYLNRFEAGQTELTDELSAKLHDPDLFSDFISDEVFKPLYDVCIKGKGMPLASFAKSFLMNRYPQDWTSRQKESSENLIGSWPVSPKRFKGETLKMLMKSIGFQVRGVPEIVKKEKLALYRVSVKPDVADRTDYRHPISAFGTQIKSPMNVLVLYGNYTPQEIIDVVAAESIVGIAVVFINYPISLVARRQMAELFHTQKSRLTSFLLIDQVLALHLALHQETERMPLMLKCTLPFTYYQPFVRDSGATADEMFCGREHELQTIVDPNGASIVYGGRQLGKTALLERAKSLCMKPNNREYAVYVSILNCDNEESVAQAISEAMKRAKLTFPSCTSLRDVCKETYAIMQKGEASRILLLIDESDRFLASINKDGYCALQPMVDLKRETKNNFKFVLAGLHNVSRMKNATSRNGILGQLGEPLCIKPLTPNEALQLISRPLTYLGFQVDRYPHLETILTSTNYYPGILQFFGYTLVETMTKQYGDYYRATDGNPPYSLHREQLGAIMNRSDLNNSIKEKFRWSLELDPRYFMIARCIALMCYDSKGLTSAIDARGGFSVEEIKQWADDLGILCLKMESSQTFINLLDEMVDMGILVRPIQDTAKYRLRRSSFLNIIGPDLDSVLADIDENNTTEG